MRPGFVCVCGLELLGQVVQAQVSALGQLGVLVGIRGVTDGQGDALGLGVDVQDLSLIHI